MRGRAWRCGMALAVGLGLAPTLPAAAFDLSQSSIPRDDIQRGGPPRDGIPALTDPATVEAHEATFLKAEDRVLGVTRGGEARAYPIAILNWHEVVNDRLGDVSIAVTYCPLCLTGMVFEAEQHGARTVFGVSGLLYNSDVLLYDRQTESLWSQLRMEAVTGARLGERLIWLPVQHTTWAAWRAAHPETDVLSLETGYQRDYTRDPYASYATSPAVMFPVGHQDARLAPKAWVLGGLLNGEAKAYPLARLTDGAIQDVLGGQPVQVHYNESARSAWMTNPTGQQLPTVQAYWFAWVAFYPETLVYAPTGDASDG